MIYYADLIGVPFANCGRDITKGFDCYGLVIEIYKRCGKNIPEYYADYNDTKAVNKLITEKTAIKSNWKKVDMANMPVPCLLAICFGTQKGVVNHCAAYIGDGKFIHIRENTGVCVDRVNSPAWRRVIEGAYKYVGN